MDAPSEQRGLTRSGVLKAGAVAALAVGAGSSMRALAGGAAASVPGARLPRARLGAAGLRRQTFVPLVGSEFRLVPPGVPALRMNLVEATQLPSRGEAFSLLFRGRARPGLASGTYRIEHPSFDGFELFVSPVDRGLRGLDLEAVINRIPT